MLCMLFFFGKSTITQVFSCMFYSSLSVVLDYLGKYMYVERLFVKLITSCFVSFF